MDDSVAREVTLGAVSSYRTWMQRYADMTHLDVWYAMIDARTVLDLFSPSDRRVTKRTLDKVAFTQSRGRGPSSSRRWWTVDERSLPIRRSSRGSTRIEPSPNNFPT